MIEAAGSLSIYDGKWKYITPNNGSPYFKLTNIESGNSKQDQLYHIRKDRSERENLATRNPKLLNRLRALLEQEKELLQR